jgi:hypothetical protein
MHQRPVRLEGCRRQPAATADMREAAPEGTKQRHSQHCLQLLHQHPQGCCRVCEGTPTSAQHDADCGASFMGYGSSQQRAAEVAIPT